MKTPNTAFTPAPCIDRARIDEPVDVVEIALGERSYPILIGQGEALWQQASQCWPAGSSAYIVTNETLAPLFAATLQARLAPHYPSVGIITLPDGEIHKNWESLNHIFDVLLQESADRRTVLFALGGGVIGDITGFAAACYMRGVAFVQLPTTLLAQVDSAVGGKTAINHVRGKNMIGAFYQPRVVVCDLATLASLPQRELSAGLAEVIKYGPIRDMVFFSWLEEHMEALMARDSAALRHAIRRSCEIKAEVVSADETEAGLREILNFGHTFGHAIEAGLGYGIWLHGQAVAAGMVLASQLSQQLGLDCDEAFHQRLLTLLEQAGLPVRAPSLGQGDNVARYLELMHVDKKARDGSMRFVVLNPPGRAQTLTVRDGEIASLLSHCVAA